MQQNEKRTIKIFALASFLNDMGSDMILPIWPFFVTSFLNANMAILGFMDGLGEAIVSISQAVSGHISDRIRKRKLFIWMGYLFCSLSRLGYSLVNTWQILVVFRILDRAGKIRSAPRDAIIADISTEENRGNNFGLLRAMDNLGAMTGILICVFFFNILGYRNLFILASIPSIIAVILILALIKEEKAAEGRIYKGISFKDISANFKLFMVASAIFALGSFSYSFLLVFAKKYGFQIGFMPILYLIFTAVATLFSLPFGRLSDKIGRRAIMQLSYLFWGLVCFILIFFQSYIAIILALIIYGLHKGAIEPAQRALVSELAPQQYRAGALGGFQMLIGICALPASLCAGVLWDKIGVMVPFSVSLGLTIISSILLYFVKEERKL